MWKLFQLGIIIWLCIAYKVYLAPDRSMGHIMLFAILVAYGLTWLISKVVDVSRSLLRSSNRPLKPSSGGLKQRRRLGRR